MHPGNSNIRVTKWVKWLEEGADEDDQVTEEQLTASVDGANSFLQPAAAATAASMPPSAVNTPPVNTPAINTSGSETPLIAIKPGMGLEVPGTVTPVGESSLQLPPSSTLPIDPSPLGTQSETATTDVQVDSQADLAISSMVTEENTQEMSARDTVPGEGDDGSNMQVEADQREYDTNMVPELQGAEAAQTRTLLGEDMTNVFAVQDSSNTNYYAMSFPTPLCWSFAIDALATTRHRRPSRRRPAGDCRTAVDRSLFAMTALQCPVVVLYFPRQSNSQTCDLQFSRSSFTAIVFASVALCSHSVHIQMRGSKSN